MSQSVLGGIRIVSDIPGEDYDEITRAKVQFREGTDLLLRTMESSKIIKSYDVPQQPTEFRKNVSSTFQVSLTDMDWREDAQVNFICSNACYWMTEKCKQKGVEDVVSKIDVIGAITQFHYVLDKRAGGVSAYL